jgi:hypothetical protein
MKEEKQNPKPTECLCCGDEYEKHQTVDTYRCPSCGHIHRHYYFSSLDFHAGDKYREGQFDIEKDLFKEVSPQEREKRKERVLKQLSIVGEYISPNQTALEVASGKGFMLSEAKHFFKKLTGNDLHPTVAKHNKLTNPEVEILVCDILDIAEDTKYDTVLAFDVLEHIEDANSFVNKISAITNKYVVVQVPVDRSLPPPNPNFDGHVHYFSKASLNELFTKNNLFQCRFMYKSKRGELANGPELIAVFERQDKNDIN